MRSKNTDMPLVQIVNMAHEENAAVLERYAMLLAHHEKLPDNQGMLVEHQAHLEGKLQICQKMMAVGKGGMNRWCQVMVLWIHS